MNGIRAYWLLEGLHTMITVTCRKVKVKDASDQAHQPAGSADPAKGTEAGAAGERKVRRVVRKVASKSEEESGQQDAGDMQQEPGKDDSVDIVDSNAPCVFFDAESGVIDYIDKESKGFEIALICSQCGTSIEFETDNCPICGESLEDSDAGIVGLVSDLTFDDDLQEEICCPLCGDLVKLARGKCPACGEPVMGSDPGGKSARLDPIVQGGNVVFLHLDVETGELSYLQRAAKKDGFEKMTVHLESA